MRYDRLLDPWSRLLADFDCAGGRDVQATDHVRCDCLNLDRGRSRLWRGATLLHTRHHSKAASTCSVGPGTIRRRCAAAHGGHQRGRSKGLTSSLRIPHLRYAIIFPDHVSLVIWRTPDEQEGFRVWSPTSQRVHHDRPTRYRDIFTYSHHSEGRESPDNIP